MTRDDDLYDHLTRSLAPGVHGHTDVKRAILLMLFGGVHKQTPEVGIANHPPPPPPSPGGAFNVLNTLQLGVCGCGSGVKAADSGGVPAGGIRKTSLFPLVPGQRRPSIVYAACWQLAADRR